MNTFKCKEEWYKQRFTVGVICLHDQKIQTESIWWYDAAQSDC